MGDAYELQKEIFAKNLRMYLDIKGKAQIDLAKKIGVSSSIASDWCNGNKMPRMDKVQSICNWLNIQKSDLLEEKEPNNGQQVYYLDDETAAIVQKMADSPEHHALFDMLSNTTPEEAQKYIELIKVLTNDNNKNN